MKGLRGGHRTFSCGLAPRDGARREGTKISGLTGLQPSQPADRHSTSHLVQEV